MGTESHILMHDIIDEHEERMINLKKFYPFFRLCDHSLNQFKEGRYEGIDMGYVVMAVLRFFIEENNFNAQRVTYIRYEQFLKELLFRDFNCSMEDPSISALIQYIFDKITNEGRPFYFEYYDPKEKKKKVGRTRLIESFYQDGSILYTISSDGIEFYLETKETKDESKINIEQLLLEKMIRSHNFKGGLDVIRRINGEVARLMLKQDEIVTLLSHNIFEGMKALEDFSKEGLKWFEEEQTLFKTNIELVEKILSRLHEENGSVKERDAVFLLNVELKKAMDRHGALLAACTKLQIQADAMMIQAKHSRFRKRVDFFDLLNRAMLQNDIRSLDALVKPLFGLRIKKTFSMERIDDLLLCRPEGHDVGEPVKEGVEENYIFEDEQEEKRIRHNQTLFLRVLFDALLHKKQVTLDELHHMYIMKFTENICLNGDYFGFLVHLSQKKRYVMDEIRKNPDTFLEQVMAEIVMKDRKKDYEDLNIELTFLPDEQIQINAQSYMTNIRFERKGM